MLVDMVPSSHAIKGAIFCTNRGIDSLNKPLLGVDAASLNSYYCVSHTHEKKQKDRWGKNPDVWAKTLTHRNHKAINAPFRTQCVITLLLLWEKSTAVIPPRGGCQLSFSCQCFVFFFLFPPRPVFQKSIRFLSRGSIFRASLCKVADRCNSY